MPLIRRGLVDRPGVNLLEVEGRLVTQTDGAATAAEVEGIELVFQPAGRSMALFLAGDIAPIA